MSREQSLHIDVPMDPKTRTAAMWKAGLRMEEIAQVVGVHSSHVYRVVNDQKHGAKAREVMAYIASALSLPVEQVFPHYERRKAA